MKTEKHQLSTKREKRMNGKHSGYKNNYMDNLQGKERVKQVKLVEMVKKRVLKKSN